MLKNNLYHITAIDLAGAGERILTEIELNKEHSIFTGHFPGNPILPGVCTVQIIRELMEEALKKHFVLIKASNIKYLGFVNPVTSQKLLFDLVIKPVTPESIHCNASVSSNGNAVCSFKGEYGLVEG